MILAWQERRLDGHLPSVSDIDWIGISEVLARLYRFNGHSIVSVAQHSLNASMMANGKRMKQLMLLHDAHEAFISDIPVPVVEWLDTVMKTEYGLDAEDFPVSNNLHWMKQKIAEVIFAAAGIEPPTDAQAAHMKEIDKRNLDFEIEHIDFVRTHTAMMRPQQDLQGNRDEDDFQRYWESQPTEILEGCIQFACNWHAEGVKLGLWQ